MAALQRKVRLLQDLRFFVETLSHRGARRLRRRAQIGADRLGSEPGSVLAGSSAPGALLAGAAAPAPAVTGAEPAAEPRRALPSSSPERTAAPPRRRLQRARRLRRPKPAAARARRRGAEPSAGPIAAPELDRGVDEGDPRRLLPHGLRGRRRRKSPRTRSASMRSGSAITSSRIRNIRFSSPPIRNGPRIGPTAELRDEQLPLRLGRWRLSRGQGGPSRRLRVLLRGPGLRRLGGQAPAHRGRVGMRGARRPRRQEVPRTAT